jgi:hypothetical protein
MAGILSVLKRADDPWWTAWRSFTLDLKSTGRTQTTVDVYMEAARQFHKFLTERERSVDPSVIDRAWAFTFTRLPVGLGPRRSFNNRALSSLAAAPAIPEAAPTEE